MRVGVVALQGGYAAHVDALRRCGVETVEVRRCSQLRAVEALVLPGGESTTLLNLMRDEPWFESLRSLHAAGTPMFGTCAGAILLSRRVVNPIQPSLGLIDADIERNAWGRQVESFETRLTVSGIAEPVPAVFIRAPRFRRTGPAVEILAEHRDEPVLVRQGNVLAATFHPELTGDDRLHRLFLTATSAERVAHGAEKVQAAN